MATEQTKPTEKAPDGSLKAIMGATNSICETLQPFTAEQRSQIMRAVSALLGAKPGGPTGPRQQGQQQPQQRGGR
jgi:hypothetical protein